MLHVYHVGIQVLAKVFTIAESHPEITLSDQDGRTVEASEQDVHPLLECVAVRLVVVHSLAEQHAVLRQVIQLAILFLPHRRRIRVFPDGREEVIGGQCLLECGVSRRIGIVIVFDGIVIVSGTRHDAQRHQEHPVFQSLLHCHNHL